MVSTHWRTGRPPSTSSTRGRRGSPCGARARRAEATSLAGERDQQVGATLVAAEAGEAACESLAARQELTQLALDEARQTVVVAAGARTSARNVPRCSWTGGAARRAQARAAVAGGVWAGLPGPGTTGREQPDPRTHRWVPTVPGFATSLPRMGFLAPRPTGSSEVTARHTSLQRRASRRT